MLVSDIVDRVHIAVGDGGGVYIKPAFIQNWVNEAIRDIFRKTSIGRDKQFAFVLNAGVSQYAGTGEIYKVHYIASSSVKLEEMIYETILDQFGWEYTSQPGEPRYFWRGYENGSTVINFAPVPETNTPLKISLVYFPEELDLVDDTDTVLPSSYIDDIIRFCVMRASERNKDFRASEKAETQYTENLAERVSDSQRIDDDFALITDDPYDYL